MSSKPICYWITEASTHEISQQVLFFVKEMSRDRSQFGYHIAADVLEKHVPQVIATHNRTLALGLLLVMLLTHPRFFTQTQSVTNPAEFESMIAYLHARLFDLMSARVQHLSVLTYDVAWFIATKQDPFGMNRRRNGGPIPRPFPLRKIMKIDIPVNSQ